MGLAVREVAALIGGFVIALGGAALVGRSAGGVPDISPVDVEHASAASAGGIRGRGAEAAGMEAAAPAPAARGPVVALLRDICNKTERFAAEPIE
jgi:hypothetical protein